MSKQETVIPLDFELTLIKEVVAKFSHSGYSISQIWATNFLVALKSKPLIILAGPPEAAKESLIKDFSSVLTGNDSYRYQAMTGHPWWANQAENVAIYTEAQSRFNTLKLETMLEEAGLPANQDRYFIAELIKISPGELHEYFSETAFQLKHGKLMRLPGTHFSESIPFPSNMSIIGTMDTVKFDWLDHDLLSQSTIINCAPIKLASVQRFKKIVINPGREKTLIRSSIRDPQRAFSKLFKILRKLPSALLPYLQVRKVLQKNFSMYTGNLLSEGIIYLANSWSYTGQGLFDEDPQKNLQIATDLAITQSLLLPNSEKIAQSEKLRSKLHKILDNRFPHAITYVNLLNPV